MKGELRPAYYALSAGRWRDYATLLHAPYTVWHLSYVVIGAAMAPAVHLDRLAWLVLAFFLAVSLGAHALDELKGRPLGTQISDGLLLGIAALSIGGALAIGVLASFWISAWALPFVLFGGFIVLAYNLEWANGRFHSDAWFGLAWGAFPCLVAYWANAEKIDAVALLLAASCFALSMAQRVLSRRAKALRRRARTATGQVAYQDGSTQEIDVPYLLEAPEAALRLLGFAMAVLASALLIARL